MKKIYRILFICLFSVLTVFPNDGSFYVSGSNLIPLQETEITLRKEVLKMFVKDYRWLEVEVDFEFYNPKTEKTLTVGFVTPPAEGDVSEEEQNHPRLENFTVKANGKTIAYKVKKMKETSFSAEKLEVSGVDFVYYFPVTFKKGLNKIRHTYRYFGGNSVEQSRNFDYQITTGKRWANKQIDDFELQIHLDNGIFSIPSSFQETAKKKPADWQIVGDGVIQKGSRKAWFEDEGPQVRMAHLNRGYLLFKAKNFKPDYDISIGEYHWVSFLGWLNRWCEIGVECFKEEEMEKISYYFSLRPDADITPEKLKEFSKKELKYMRNYFYAIRGLDFNDEEIRRFYSRFFWYKPDKNLNINTLQFSKDESGFIEKIKDEEQKR